MPNVNLSTDENIAKTKTHKKPFGAKSFKTAKTNGRMVGGVKNGGKSEFKKRGVLTRVKAGRSNRKLQNKFVGLRHPIDKKPYRGTIGSKSSKKVKSAEELNEELDEYMKNADN